MKWNQLDYIKLLIKGMGNGSTLPLFVMRFLTRTENVLDALYGHVTLKEYTLINVMRSGDYDYNS